MAQIIKKLTDEQIARIPEFRKKWLKIGLSTERADRARAEAGVKLAYEAAGKKPPSLVIWLDSPRAGAMGAALLAGTKQAGAQVGAQVRAQVWAQVGAQVGAQVWDQVWAQVRAQVGAQVWDQVWAQVRAQVGAQVGAQVWAQVRDQVWDQVWAQVWAQVRDQVGAQVWAQVWAQVRDQVGAQVGDQVGAQVGAQVRAQVWAQVGDQVGAQVGDQVGAQVGAQVNRAVCGQHEAGWLSFYAFFAEACGLESAKRLKGLSEVAQSCGWWWPFENAVIMTDRPVSISRDDQNRLHNETGSALSYSDGFEIHAWHGTRVPKEWIEQKTTIDPSMILREENVELRAVGATIIGWPRMLSVLKAKIINDSGSPDIGQLIELKLPGLPEPGRFLKALCPRNGIICEGVPRISDIDGLPIETAIHAQAWRIGDPLSDYQHPPQRT